MFRTTMTSLALAAMCVAAFLMGIGAARGGSQELTAILAAPTAFAATSSGDVYHQQGYGDLSGNAPLSWSLVGHITSSSPIIAIRHMGGDATSEYVWAYAADGSFFVSNDNGRTWALKGNVFGGSTPVTETTWGGLKVRYR